jgi:hypothetical protein
MERFEVFEVHTMLIVKDQLAKSFELNIIVYIFGPSSSIIGVF